MELCKSSGQAYRWKPDLGWQFGKKQIQKSLCIDMLLVINFCETSCSSGNLWFRADIRLDFGTICRDKASIFPTCLAHLPRAGKHWNLLARIHVAYKRAIPRVFLKIRNPSYSKSFTFRPLTRATITHRYHAEAFGLSLAPNQQWASRCSSLAPLAPPSFWPSPGI